MPFTLEMSAAAHVDAPPEAVWAVFRDVEEWPRWSDVCLDVWDVSPQLWDVGAKFSFRLRMARRGVPFSVAVTESDPPRRVAWASTKLTVTATRTFTFEPSDAGTLVTDHKLFSSPVLPLALFYPRPVIRNMTQAWLRDLKAETERRARESAGA